MAADQMVRKQVLTLAIPAILENLLLSMVEYVDTAMVGSLGPDATAAVACSGPVTRLLTAVAMAISVGGTVAVAQAIGRTDGEKARKVTGQSFLAMSVIGLGLGLVLYLLSGIVPVFMGAEEEVQAAATVYLKIIAVGLPFNFLSVVFYGLLRGAGDTVLPMKMNVLTNLCNVAGNYLLIFPSRTIKIATWQLPMWGAGLGVAGAALSTTLFRILFSVALFFLMCKREDVTLQVKGLTLDKEVMKEIVGIGLPTTLERISISGGQMCYVRVVGSLGTVSLAAHQLALTAESISYMPAHGFQTAATTLVGQTVGAKQYEAAKERSRVTLQLCTICIFGMSLFLFFGCRWILHLFTPSEAVIEEGCTALRIIAFVEPFFGMSSVYTGALRGAGDTKQPFFVCLMTMWAIRLPMAYLMVKFFRLGLAGAWIAMAMDLIVRGLLMAYRFRKGDWLKRLLG